MLVWELEVLSLPKESPQRLPPGRTPSKLSYWLSDPVDSRGGYRSTLRRGPPMNDMSDDSGSEKSGNAFLADVVGPLENGDMMKLSCIGIVGNPSAESLGVAGCKKELERSSPGY